MLVHPSPAVKLLSSNAARGTGRRWEVFLLKATISDHHKRSKVGQRRDKRRITYGKCYLLRYFKS